MFFANSLSSSIIHSFCHIFILCIHQCVHIPPDDSGTNQKKSIKLALVHTVESRMTLTMTEQGNDNGNQPYTVSHMAGGSIQVIEFREFEEYNEWHSELRAITDRIAHINEHKWYPEPRLSCYRNDWLPMVYAFRQKWGANRVPEDVQRSCKEVEAGLQEADDDARR